MTSAEDEIRKSSPVRKRHVPKAKDSDHGTSPLAASAPNRVRQGIHKQQLHEKAQHRRISHVQRQSHSSMQKFFLVIILNLLLLLMGVMLYFRPEFFFQQYRIPKREWPPHHLALLYPPHVSPRRDLPPFFESYSIATAENADARNAVRYLLKTRQRLKPFSILLTGWERNEMWNNVPLDDHCGTGFQRAYEAAVQRGAIRHSEDLILWCLVRTYQNDGFLQWNVTFERAPTSMIISNATNNGTSVKGLAAKYVAQDRIHPSIMWVPKRKEIHHVNSTEGIARKRNLFDMDTDVPTEMLIWLIQGAPRIEGPLEYPKSAEEYLYQLIMHEESDKWVFLDVFCDEDVDIIDPALIQQLADQTVVARECQTRQSCCTVYMPHDLEDPRMRQLRNRQNSGDG